MKFNLLVPSQWPNSHGDNLPTIRVAEIHLRNFKSVKNGKITLNCGKKFIPYGTEPDIAAIYGQNGSGKTAVIEALSILKYLLLGASIPDEFADCIDVESDSALLEFTFDFQYPQNDGMYPSNGDVRKVVYTFSLKRSEGPNLSEPNRKETDFSLLSILGINKSDSHERGKGHLIVFDEILKVSGLINGKKAILKPFLDTSSSKSTLEPQSKVAILLGKMDNDKQIALGVNQQRAEEKAKSFIFMPEMLALYLDNDAGYSAYLQMILELRYWGTIFLQVVDSKITDSVGFKVGLPVGVVSGIIYFDLTKPISVPEESLDHFNDFIHDIFDELNIVLTEVIPGLSVNVRKCGTKISDSGKKETSFELISMRGEKEIPIGSESEGVKKLISTMSFLIMAFAQQSYTLAYDEFDSGIFEFLLGELLDVMQSSGKGQFIFTTHNMRPLEVLKKDYIWFTTTDPENRYIKLSGIGGTNNMRNVYYREIATQEHYDNLYLGTRKNRIISAMRKAGGAILGEA